jgi:arylsulfatase A-like enzyme
MTHSFRFVLVLFGVASAALAAAPAGRPNILFILADDLGLDGLSCYGSDVRKTPNLDKLAASGTRFETCYAAPLCGPSRCLLMTGRYAFRTGGITNQSWRGGGPGAKSADEQPMAKLMKQAGYATGMAGKWRQVGETAGGWYWQTTHQQNGQEISVPAGTYAPDVIQNFTLNFLRRHKDEPFSFMAIDRQSGR